MTNSSHFTAQPKEGEYKIEARFTLAEVPGLRVRQISLADPLLTIDKGVVGQDAAVIEKLFNEKWPSGPVPVALARYPHASNP